MNRDQQTLLAVFAHPDDESFGTGGVLARYASEGARVVLVCATRGEAGEISDPALATRITLGAVREQELRSAAKMLGISEVVFLGYRDSGMAGTAENSDPRAFVNAGADEVVSQLVGIIRRERPGAIVTFEPHGGYGHPDHIMIHHATTAAVQAAAAPTYVPGLGEPWRTPRLFWTVIPRSSLLKMRDLLAAQGEDTSAFDRMAESGAGWPDDAIDLTIDVSAFAQAKWESLNSHQTQFGEDNAFRRATEAMMEELLNREFFVLAQSAPGAGPEVADLIDERR